MSLNYFGMVCYDLYWLKDFQNLEQQKISGLGSIQHCLILKEISILCCSYYLVKRIDRQLGGCFKSTYIDEIILEIFMLG